MNKLYKYLPFGIKGILSKDDYGNIINTTGTFVGYSEGIITMYDEERNPEFGEEKDFKPILRPFEDLTKELPLTKSAAEIIGRKEGELFNPLVMMFKYNNKITDFDFQNVNAVKVEDKFIVNLNTETKNVKIEVDVELDSDFNLSINSYAWQKKENYRIATCYYTINPNCFDFFRAMHFNLDFEENEYIKLEN